MNEAKPFVIDKRLVWEAYHKVKENKGSAGIDKVDQKTFDKEMSKNLYKIWNRMSSGCYFPKAVKLVEIPKSNGGTRPLGIPTIEDRIAQYHSRQTDTYLLRTSYRMKSMKNISLVLNM